MTQGAKGGWDGCAYNPSPKNALGQSSWLVRILPNAAVAQNLWTGGDAAPVAFLTSRLRSEAIFLSRDSSFRDDLSVFPHGDLTTP